MQGKQRKLLAHLKSAQTIAESMATASAADDASLADRLRAEARRHEQFTTAFMLAFISDEMVPVSSFRAWASYGKFRLWEKAGLISMQRKNRKACVRPSQFIELWRQL
ncbi:MAG: hypothetical protein HYV75_08600 [Opitutae bacterium]|nr:hypothetical protein [Opitutae bacterium]